jgi:hypothetical protein
MMTTTTITDATARDGISDQPVPQQVLVVDGRIGPQRRDVASLP